MSTDIEKVLTDGIVFKKGKDTSPYKKAEPKKVKSKAKKTTYAKGTHGSGAAKMKAEFRRKRAARNK
ncbi:hypothetical protein [uncultured Bacteroides sp.]|uniref:hypothetical protein n=1 Tax=uncultured Bacteroides sp. TaxID=162156 RepID=UPI002AAC046B|nr:hypothetical protein [uncultured Bacteroides sp.]